MLVRLFALLLLLAASGAGGVAVWRSMQVEPPRLKAARLLQAKDVLGAQVVLRGMVKADPRDAEAHVMLARTAILISDWLSAEKEAKTLRMMGYDRMVTLPLLVRAYAAQERYPDILADVPAVSSKPSEQFMNLALRSIGFMGLGDVGLAQGAVEAAAKLAPDEFLVHLQQARLALVQGDIDSGLGQAALALQLRPTSIEALQTKSALLGARNDLGGAIGALDQALDIAPRSQDLRLQRATLLLGAGRDAEAKVDVEAVLGVASTNEQALFDHGMLLLRARQLADANAEFDKLGLKMDQYPLAYYYKALIAKDSGNTQSALDSLSRFLKLRPGDWDGIRLTSQLEIQEGRPDLALEVLAAATVPGSADAAAFDLQGRAYFMLGKTAEAVTSFRQATMLAPASKEYSSHLAAAQTQFGAAPVSAHDRIGKTP